MTRRYLSQESARVVEKLSAGGVLRPRVVQRRSPALALRYAFEGGDVVALQTIDHLLSRGIVLIGEDGAIRRTGRYGEP